MNTPRLPEPGWLPDPGRTDIERYWDGASWTLRTRDRVSKLERVPLASAPSRSGVGWKRSARRIGVSLGVWTFVFGVFAWNGMLPSWFPLHDSLNRGAPHGPDVAYPVFHSNDLVAYLARSMVAQVDEIDVTYWTNQGYGDEELRDAYLEAMVQNPYVFTDGSGFSGGLAKHSLTPVYTYDDAEAERRRRATRDAVLTAVVSSGALGAGSEAESLALLHDYIARIAEYDDEAWAAMEAGERSADSPVVARSQEAYGILVEGTAVCNGYAQALKLVAHEVGIESYIVTGEVNDGPTVGSHAWNMLLVDGEWKVVDLTWNDVDAQSARRDYFLLSVDDPLLDTREIDGSWLDDASAEAWGWK